MSDLCMYELEDMAWDEFCQSDDHIVPHPGFDRGDDPSILGESCKKPRREVTIISNTAGDRSARYAGQGKEQGGFSTLSKTRNMMLEQDSWSPAPNGAFPSSSDSNSIKEVSSLASDNTRTSGFKSNNTDSNDSEICENDTILSDKSTAVNKNSFSYPLGDITQTSNDVDFFQNTEEKDPSDFLYYGWPEIGNFDDVDRMFRSCDSTFGLGACKENELGWLSSADDAGGSGDLLKSDFKFPFPESNAVEDISENNDSSKCYSIDDSAMTSAPIRFKDSSWPTDTSDSYMSFVNGYGPVITDSKDGFILKEQGMGLKGKIQAKISVNGHSKTGNGGMVNEHKKQSKHQNQFEGKRKKHYLGNASFNYVNNLPNEVTQLPSGAISHPVFPSVGPEIYKYLQNTISYLHSDNSHLSVQTSVDPTPSSVKSETKDLTYPSQRESSHASSQLQSLEGSHPSYQVAAIKGGEKKEKLANRQGSQPSLNSTLGNACPTLRASKCDPDTVGKLLPGDEFENHSDVEGVSSVIPAELGSSDLHESSSMSSGLDDISLEAASFRQLQHVMEQLDLKTKLCIRDSLYRLARSAKQRHYHANLNGGWEDERGASGAFMADGTNKCTGFMDMETDTNPIDRSIAHLLFHRPSDSPAVPAHNSLPFKSPRMVHGSITSPPVMVDNLVNREETCAETEKQGSYL